MSGCKCQDLDFLMIAPLCFVLAHKPTHLRWLAHVMYSTHLVPQHHILSMICPMHIHPLHPDLDLCDIFTPNETYCKQCDLCFCIRFLPGLMLRQWQVLDNCTHFEQDSNPRPPLEANHAPYQLCYRLAWCFDLKNYDL